MSGQATTSDLAAGAHEGLYMQIEEIPDVGTGIGFAVTANQDIDTARITAERLTQERG
jgi:hypothetical protein